jgi:hypothetical protein
LILTPLLRLNGEEDADADAGQDDEAAQTAQ